MNRTEEGKKLKKTQTQNNFENDKNSSELWQEIN